MADVTIVNPQKPANYFEALDGIRGIGCFFVLLIHFRFTVGNLPFSVAYTCLHSFFIMSAYLITRNLIKEKDRAKNFWNFFKVFYIKRTARIFPVYFLYIFVVIFLFLFVKIAFHKNVMGVIPELKRYGWMLFTFLYNLKMQVIVWKGLKDHLGLIFPHLWSVSLEEQFYFTVIFLLWICNKTALRVISVLFIVLIPFMRIYGYHLLGEQTNDDYIRTLTLIHSPYYQFDSFFYGIAMAVFDVKKTKKLIWLFYISMAVILGHTIINTILCAREEHVSVFSALRDDKYFYRNYGIYFLDVVLNIFSCAWIYCVLYYPKQFSFFSNKLLVRFGELSYGLYIFQFLVLGTGVILTAVLMHYLHFPAFIAELLGFTCYIIINYYLAVWINNKVEKPVAGYKDKLLKQIKAGKQQ